MNNLMIETLSPFVEGKTQTPEAKISDYFTLLKPKVMSLVIFTGFIGLLIAPGAADMHPLLAFVAMLSLAIGAGASGAINMWYDHDIDSIMHRTKDRPLPQKRIHREDALAFGIILSLLSVMMMGLAVNWVAASILAFANFFYVCIYTMWLKRTTPQNIVIGGAAGAFPPMIGWAAVTGDITLYPILLFLMIFVWTPPHFWALSLFANEDYKRAKIPMLPVVKGEKHTKLQMLIYTLILWPITIAPSILGFASLPYGLCAALLSGFFIYTALKTYRDPNPKNPKLMFAYSVFYLFALFLAIGLL